MAHIDYKTACNIMGTDIYSKFEKITSEKHIILPPKYLGQIKQGITEHLNSEVRLVSDLFDGVLIAYSNLKLKQKTGMIMDELPFIHFDIEADFIVFKPVIGCILRAKVNKISKNHIGCLVHECFNASIPKPRHVTDVWKGCDVAVGDEVLFVVDSIYTQNRVLSIRGHLKDTSAKGQKQGKKRNRTSSYNTTQESESVEEVNDNLEENISPTKRIKSESDETGLEVKEKRKKKRKKEREAQSEADGTTFEVTEKEEKRKKPKKEKGSESETVSESYNDKAGPSSDTCGANLTLDLSGIDTLASSATKKDKKKKKQTKSNVSTLSESGGNSADFSDMSTLSQIESFHEKVDTRNSVKTTSDSSVLNANTSVKNTNIKESQSDSSAVVSYTKLKKHKKQKQKQNDSSELGNISCQENGDITASVMKTDIDISLTQGNKKQKKHKHKKHKNDEDIDSSVNVFYTQVSEGQASTEELESSMNLSQSSSSSGKKQKKKKKKEKLL